MQNLQISTTARIAELVRQKLQTGPKTVPELYEAPDINNLATGPWSVKGALKSMHRNKMVRKIPHQDSVHPQVKFAYEIIGPREERRSLTAKPDHIPERRAITTTQHKPQQRTRRETVTVMDSQKPEIRVTSNGIRIELANFNVVVELHDMH
jgi:hypothetical protein